MHPGMERLDPTVQHLREPGHGRHVGHGQAGPPERPGGPTRRHELVAGADESGREVGQPGLVGHGQQRSARDGQARIGALGVEPDRPAIGGDGQRTGQQARHGSRQQTVLDGPDAVLDAGDVVAGHDRDRLLGDDRTAVEGFVDEVDRAARDGHAVRQGVRDGVGPREGGQERGMRVEDAGRQRGQDARPDDPHVARQHGNVRVDCHEGLGQCPIVAAGEERRLDALFGGPVERRARPIGKDRGRSTRRVPGDPPPPRAP